MVNNTFSYKVYDHKSALQNFAFKFTQNLDDADDLVQDTILKAMRYSKMFQDGSNMKAWLYTIMKNTFINDYRKASKRLSVMDTTEEISSAQLFKSASENNVNNKFISDDVNKALNKLNPDYYIPFTKYFEGYKYHEIADMLNIPIGTIKTRIHVARQLLKNDLKIYSEEYKKSNKVN
jgi:RNA polymerase sigma factor (sigma-70 family)